MQGIWLGQYWYDHNKRLPEILTTRRTNFKLDIIFTETNKFSGNVEDDLNSGGTPGIGTINGVIKNGSISFVKRMPIKSVIYTNGERRILNGRHPNIYYTGILNKETQTLTGTSKFKFHIHWFGIIPIPLLPISGNWSARKSGSVLF